MSLVIKILHGLGKIFLSLLIWFFLVEAPIGIYILKDGGIYYLDDNYYLAGWPGRIWDDVEGHPIYGKILGDVTKYSVTKNYILVYTEEGGGWFAVNKNTHSVSENYQSFEKLSSDLRLPDTDIQTGRPWLRLRYFWHIPIYVCIGVVTLLLFWRSEIRKLFNFMKTIRNRHCWRMGDRS